MKSFLKTLKSLWDKTPESVKRVFHTAWVAFTVPMGAGILPILKTLLKDHNLSAATSMTGALILASLMAAGTAIRVSITALANRNK